MYRYQEIDSEEKNPDNEKEIEFDVIRSIEIFPPFVWCLRKE